MRNLLRLIDRFRKDRGGSVAIIMGVLIIPLVGALGIGFEVSNWYMTVRGMQNAADAAAIAAAVNAGANYDVEAKAVAAQYGFVDGTNTISIAVSNTAACPDGSGNNCYSVAISGSVPLLVSQVVGFAGDATVNGAKQKNLSSLAVAKQGQTNDNPCLLALASSGAPQGIRTNGAPTGNMNGCNSMSNTAAQCNGHDLGLGISYAVGSNSGCGAKQRSSPALADPYAYMATANPGGIPALSSSGCAGSYPQETHHGNSSSGGTARSGPINLSAGNTFWCGDQLLTGDVTITAPASGAVLIIENGQLDLNGHVFQTSAGSALTLVFSGTNGGGYIHAPTDNTNGPGGGLDITPPTTGPWAGVAIYQDPSLTTGVDISSAGNSPTWNITGLVYTPHATVNLKGAVDKSTNGKSCLVLVADNFQISGTGGILKTDIGQCQAAGLNMPTVKIPGGAVLVL
jgi:Putative Flp pilus-assembly TadE/G-like